MHYPRPAPRNTIFDRRLLEEQYQDLHQQHQAATLGMWVFLATEVMFFGALFLAVAVYHVLYPTECEKASERLNWHRRRQHAGPPVEQPHDCPGRTPRGARPAEEDRALPRPHRVLGICFLCLKGLEYYLDYRENLIPGWKFVNQEWIAAGLAKDQVPHVKLFLFLYWVMTLLHGLHVTIGIGVVLVVLGMAWRGRFSTSYYSPVDITALYWHFVDIVWIFLLPTLYLVGTHHF